MQILMLRERLIVALQTQRSENLVERRMKELKWGSQKVCGGHVRQRRSVGLFSSGEEDRMILPASPYICMYLW